MLRRLRALGVRLVLDETQRQAARFPELGCDLGQGYLFSRPMPAAKTARRLRAPAIRAPALRRAG